MAKRYFMPLDDEGKVALLSNLMLKLPDYTTTLGITPADITAVTADFTALNWTITLLNGVRTSGQQWTTFKNILRDGPVSEPPNAPLLPDTGTPPPLLPGVVPRLIDLANRIKASPNYTDAIGEDLGIVGPEIGTDLLTIKPILVVRLLAGHPEIVWKKQGMTALEIHVDRGTGWVVLAVDTVPNYIDTAALPATPAVWKYKAIYRLADSAVGQWSDVASITISA